MIRGALLGRGHLVIQRTRYFDFGRSLPSTGWEHVREGRTDLLSLRENTIACIPVITP
jgi:hypothetical protein